MEESIETFVGLLRPEHVFSIAFLVIVWFSIRGMREDFWPGVRQFGTTITDIIRIDIVPAWREDRQSLTEVLRQLASNQRFILEELRQLNKEEWGGD